MKSEQFYDLAVVDFLEDSFIRLMLWHHFTDKDGELTREYIVDGVTFDSESEALRWVATEYPQAKQYMPAPVPAWFDKDLEKYRSCL
jgi:hypothetical protein